ncbi:MAG: glycerol-3-phosphate acyltransferase [Anaerolineales bacterium]|nr:glycerol-3-phosphate acyltransferase [Anaerolineales bacterium]
MQISTLYPYPYLFPIFGYLSGSLPFALWVTRLVKGIDVRDGGSGHVTTTNTIRQAGLGWGILVLILDISKGFVPAYFTARLALPYWAVALTAGLAVVGHCWPLFAQFRGGMGLATTGGCLLAINPLGLVIGLGVLVSLILTIRHSARAAFFTGLLIPVALWLLAQRGLIIWVSVATGIVVAIRFLDDWNREYRELWLDREQ